MKYLLLSLTVVTFLVSCSLEQETTPTPVLSPTPKTLTLEDIIPSGLPDSLKVKEIQSIVDAIDEDTTLEIKKMVYSTSKTVSYSFDLSLREVEVPLFAYYKNGMLRKIVISGMSTERYFYAANRLIYMDYICGGSGGFATCDPGTIKQETSFHRDSILDYNYQRDGTSLRICSCHRDLPWYTTENPPPIDTNAIIQSSKYWVEMVSLSNVDD